MVVGNYGYGFCGPAAVAHNYGTETLVVEVVLIFPQR